jgi:hypothetical protein
MQACRFPFTFWGCQLTLSHQEITSSAGGAIDFALADQPLNSRSKVAPHIYVPHFIPSQLLSRYGLAQMN